MTWLPIESGGATPFDRAFGLVPRAYDAFRDLDAALAEPDALDPELVTLCRLRIDQLVGAEQTVEPSSEKATALRSWPTSPLYDETDRAALNFAEKYVIDASSVDDADCAALRVHLSDPEITALVIAIAMADAMARFRVALDV